MTMALSGLSISSRKDQVPRWAAVANKAGSGDADGEQHGRAEGPDNSQGDQAGATPRGRGICSNTIWDRVSLVKWSIWDRVSLDVAAGQTLFGIESR